MKPKTNRPLKKKLPLDSIHKFCVLFAVLACRLAEQANVVAQRG